MKKFAIKLVTNLIPIKKYRRDLRNKLLTEIIEPKLDPNNKILLIEGSIEKEVPSDYFKGLRIVLNGENSVIRIHSPYKFGTSVINIWSDAKFEMKSSKYAVHATQFYIGKSARIDIGENFSCNGALIANNISGNFLIIGNDCMFSRNIIVRADDGHIICKKGTSEIVNNSKGTKIGNHVWVAERAFIGKDVEIADGCIIGACSTVIKGTIEENVILAGVPAKIVKRDIEWHRENHNAPPPCLKVRPRASFGYIFFFKVISSSHKLRYSILFCLVLFLLILFLISLTKVIFLCFVVFLLLFYKIHNLSYQALLTKCLLSFCLTLILFYCNCLIGLCFLSFLTPDEYNLVLFYKCSLKSFYLLCYYLQAICEFHYYDQMVFYNPLNHLFQNNLFFSNNNTPLECN